jgi:L-alanine-DL-glutamate epimerase-like enolase superfamily enzyme
MRLVRHTLYRYRLPYARAVKWSDIIEDGADFLLLRLTADTGEEGVAETVLKPTWNGASARTIAAALEDILLPWLQDQDVSDPVAVAARLAMIPGQQAACTLLDNALWDLRAAAARTPLWQHWGGRDTVDLSWVLTRQAPFLMVQEADDIIARHGFRALKVKGGQGVDVDLQAVRAIRDAVGSRVALYVDANGAYPHDVAQGYVDAMTDAGAAMVEDPSPLAPDAAFEALQASLASPVLVDFGNTGLRDTALFLERGARAISLKPGRFGLSATRRMAQMAAAHDALTVVGMFGESALGTLTALAQAACLPDSALPAETTWYLAMTAQIVDLPAIRDGRLRLPEAGGLAQQVDWDRLTSLTRS